MNRVKALRGRLGISQSLVSIILLVSVIIAVIVFFSFRKPYAALLLLLCLVPAARFLQKEEALIKISTIRNNGRSIAFSDEGRRRFAALSAIEIRIAGFVGPESGESQSDESRFLKASKILAEYIGSCSIEVSNRGSAIRYFATAEATNASDACQRSEATAERILRVIQELYGSNPRPGILEGEQLRSACLSILGGEFDAFSGAGNVVIRDGEETDESHGLAVLTANDPSFARIDLRKLLSLIRNIRESVTYVINLEARQTYNENVLIDGAECGRMWMVSPYFVVRGREVRDIEEASVTLRNDIEDITKSGVIRIERGSSIMKKLGMIFFRWRIDKKLFLLNEQLISHMFQCPIRLS